MKVIHEIAGYTAMGEPVFYFKVVNASGAWVGFTNWGARWIEAGVPDGEGRLTDVIADGIFVRYLLYGGYGRSFCQPDRKRIVSDRRPYLSVGDE
mgnify:CR=1 FL=1